MIFLLLNVCINYCDKCKKNYMYTCSFFYIYHNIMRIFIHCSV